jgi:hypothetical protein
MYHSAKRYLHAPNNTRPKNALTALAKWFSWGLLPIKKALPKCQEIKTNPRDSHAQCPRFPNNVGHSKAFMPPEMMGCGLLHALPHGKSLTHCAIQL